MAEYLLSEHLNFTLTWVGFGTVLGLLALIVLPSKDGRGALATVLMATAGTMIGCVLIQKMSSYNEWVQPMTPHGAVVGASGAIVMLIFFRVLGGDWLANGGKQFFRQHRRRRRRYLITEGDEATPLRRRDDLLD